MKKWRERGLRPTQCLLIDCVSFTVSIVLVALLPFFFRKNLYRQKHLQNFVCTSLISVLIYFSSRLPIESEILSSLITLLDVAAVCSFWGWESSAGFPGKSEASCSLSAFSLRCFSSHMP